MRRLRNGPCNGGPSERGQTTIDFAIGISIFLISIAFAFTFIPDIINPLISPFDPGTNVAAERTADMVIEKFLHGGQPDASAVTVDTGCTLAFFTAEGGTVYSDQYVDDCPNDRFGTLGTTNESMLGLNENTQDVNVTVVPVDGTRSNPVVFTDSDKPPRIDTNGNVTLSRGEPIGYAQNPSSTSRIVYINGETYRLVVTVW